MNITITAAILEIFLVCVLVSFFYWHVARVVGVRALRFRLFSRRDKLRRLAWDHVEDHRSFAYQELEGFICKTISAVPSISLASFLLFWIRHPNPTSKEMERFREEASPQLQTLLGKTVEDAVYLMMLNSPILVTVAAIVALLLRVAGRFKKMLVYRQVEYFVEELPSGTEALSQAA